MFRDVEGSETIPGIQAVEGAIPLISMEGAQLNDITLSKMKIQRMTSGEPCRSDDEELSSMRMPQAHTFGG